MGENGLDVDFLVISVKLAVVVVVFVDGYREIGNVVVQLNLAHGIITFKADGVAVVEHALDGKAADNTKVERLLVFRFRSAEVQPIGRSEAAGKTDVVKRFRGVHFAAGRGQGFPELGLGKLTEQEEQG